MSWLGTVFIGIITAAIGCVLSLYIASMAVRWYSISSFEGGSGYYVIAFGLLGLIVGLGLGVVSSRVVAAMADPGFFKALGISVATMLAIVGVVGGIGRLRADVAPTIDGEELMVMVEARWPENESPPPASVPGISSVSLGSVVGHVQRKAVKGALWKEDAQLIDGRWVVPGAVYLFTERGDRVLDFSLNDSVRVGFQTRLPRRPGKEFLEWSEWYPKDGRTGPTMKTGVTFRYRVQKVSQPMRTEKLGAFSVGAIANGFQHEIADGTTTLDPYARFDVQYGGKALELPASEGHGSGATRVGMLAQMPSDKPALVAYVDPEREPSYCALLVDDNGTMRTQRIADCSNVIQVEELTNDASRFEALKNAKVPKGRIDRHTYASSSLLLFNSAVLNTKTLALHPFTAQSEATLIPSVPPLGVSPDLGSFVRYCVANHSDDFPVLVVTDFVHNRTYDLPIDKDRMRFAALGDLTPDWMLHHFEWQRGTEGADVLKARVNFVPIPYHGDVDAEEGGKFRYRVPMGGQKIRLTLVQFMEQNFGAKREPVEDDAYEYPITVDGKKIMVATTGGSADYVLVSMAHGEAASDLVQRIGMGFNAALATGKHDALFVK